ncbi:zinc finger protein 1, partial [Biomphalaria pfeifferi]
KSTLKQEVEMTHCTDMNKSLSLASRLLAMSEKANNSHCVPIIMPKYESLRQTPVPEVSLSQQLQFIEEDEAMTSEKYKLAENRQDQLEEYHHSEKEIDFQKSFQCQICLKEFSQSSHLKNHQLTHTGLQNIKMLICQRGFSTSSELKRYKLGDIGEENDNLTKVQFREQEKEMTLVKNVQTVIMQDQQEQYRPNEIVLSKEADGDNSKLHSQQSENFAGNFGDQKSTFKQEVEITHFTDTNKSLSLASRLLAISEKADNSHCVPIIMPKCESLKHTPVPEVPLNQQEKLIEEDQDMTSEKCFLANNIHDQLEPCRPNETAISTETCHQTKQNLCQICLKQLSTPFHLGRHLLTHTGEKPFKCHTCQKGFSNPHNLKCHQMTHTGEKPFICEICLKGFATSSQLRKHQFRKHRPIHTTEKTFKCQICLKEFSQSSHLKNHQQIHTGLKNIKMLICQRGFSDSSDLERHQTVLSVENHENFSKVQFIEKDEVMTSENYELADNMQDQSEEYHHREQVLRKEINFQKSFQCQICLKEFSQSSHLKNHQLSHTVLKNIKMLICQRGFSTSLEMKRQKLAYIGEENDNLSKVQFSEEKKNDFGKACTD